MATATYAACDGGSGSTGGCGTGIEERELYAFGQNAYGELGVGDARQRYSPTVVEFSLGKDVVQVTAGNELTAVLTNTGEVYVCGSNAWGQCGVGESAEPLSSFTKISLQESRFGPGGRAAVVHSSNRSEHLCVITEEGELHTCGCNSTGQLGHGVIHGSFPSLRPVRSLTGHIVTKAVFGSSWGDGRSHGSLYVTEDDQTWTFGGNSFGQLGHGDTEERAKPTSVVALRGRGVRCVACGVYHTVVVVTSGGMMGFGSNSQGQLGVEGIPEICTPGVQPDITAVLTDVACGYLHTAVLTESGEVLTCGRNDYGQLGLGHREVTRVPQQVQDLRGKTIVQVACGSFHTVALDSNGRVYPFGRNNYGQLGTGTREDSYRPCFVEKLSDKFVCQVAAGFFHTMCLTGPPRRQDRGLRAVASAKTLSSDLYQLLNNPSGSDVSFEVEGKVVYGHRCIISARCEPLSRMLEGPMKEARTGAREAIPVPNHKHAIFLAFLEFLYTDKVMALGVDTLDLDLTLDLLEVADQYLVEALKRLCENAFVKAMTVESACSMLATADSRQALSLRDRCLSFVVSNFGMVVSTAGWAALPPELVEEVKLEASQRGKQVGHVQDLSQQPAEKRPRTTAA